MSTPHVGASSSRETLRTLAESLAELMDCECDVSHGDDEDCGTPFCPCGGDDCWHCGAIMALANAGEADGEVAALREKLATARRLLETVDAIMVPVNREEARTWWDARDRAIASLASSTGGGT